MGKWVFGNLVCLLAFNASAQTLHSFSIQEENIRFDGTIEEGVLRDYMNLEIIFVDPLAGFRRKCTFKDLWLKPGRTVSQYEENDPESNYWARCDRDVCVKEVMAEPLRCTLFDDNKRPIYSVMVQPDLRKVEVEEVCVIQKCKDGVETTQETTLSYEVAFQYEFPNEKRQSSFHECTRKTPSSH